MGAPSSAPAVRPFAGGVPRRAAAAAPSDASERATGKKRPRVAPPLDSSACLPKMARTRNSVVTAAGMEVLTVGGEMPVPGDPAQERLKKRLASEPDALRCLLKKAELISRRGGECKAKGGAPTAAGKKERFLASSNQRPKPIEDGGGNAPSVKKRKISTLVVEQKQKLTRAPRMSPEERNLLARRLSSLSGGVPGHIVEFLQKQFGDADTNGEIEINMDSVEDSVLFELKMRLDKLAEESKHGKVAALGKGEVLPEQKQKEEYIDDSCGVCPIVETGNKPSSSSSGGSGECADRPAQVPPEQTVATSEPPPSEQSAEAKKVRDVQRAAPKAVYMPGLIYRANLRRQLMEMERAVAVLPDQSIHRRELQRLGIAEYGCPSVMRQIGLVLKADA